jgi:small subunit ribosomal protein S16
LHTGGFILSVKIRLTRKGAKKQPFYRIVVADSRFPRDGRFIENIGIYNPKTDPSTIEVDKAKAVEWLNKGAIPTGTVKKIFEIVNLKTENTK